MKLKSLTLCLENEDHIPRPILELPGVSKLLLSGDNLIATNDSEGLDTGSLASALLGQARAYQATASNYRIGQTVKTVGSTSTQSNLAKVRQLQAQRQQKRDEAKQIETNIRICATLWQLHVGKLTQVCLTVLRTFDIQSIKHPIRSRLCAMSRLSLLRLQPGKPLTQSWKMCRLPFNNGIQTRVG